MDMIEALEQYMKAKAEHDKARDACDHDWGYFGFSHRERLASAKAEYENALFDFVNKRIAEAISSHVNAYHDGQQ